MGKHVSGALLAGNNIIPAEVGTAAGRFSQGIPWGISGTFHFMLLFQAEHNILMNPFHQLGVIGALGGSFLCAMHGSLVNSILIRTTRSEHESINTGYKFGQRESTYSFGPAQGYLWQLFWRRLSFPNSRSLRFFLAAWPVAGIWSAALGINVIAFGFGRFNFNQPSIIDPQGI